MADFSLDPISALYFLIAYRDLRLAYRDNMSEHLRFSSGFPIRLTF